MTQDLSREEIKALARHETKREVQSLLLEAMKGEK